MYILTPITNHQYRLYQGIPDMDGMCRAVQILGTINYSLALLLKATSIHNPTDTVFSSSGVLYYIELLPVLVAVDSWSGLYEEVNNLAMLEAL